MYLLNATVIDWLFDPPNRPKSMENEQHIQRLGNVTIMTKTPHEYIRDSIRVTYE